MAFHKSFIRANNKIRAREVLVIDADGKSLGVMGLAEAMTVARRRELDLVEISPNANPPVCKVIEYGKYLYDLSKREKDARKNTAATKLKELNFHVNIDEHDYGVKMRHAEEFMWKGMKVKLQLKFRGREMMHQDLGMRLIRRMREDLGHIGIADSEPKLIGKSINLMLTPLPARKRVRKFSVEDNEPAEEEALEDGDTVDLKKEHHSDSKAAPTPAPDEPAPSQIGKK